MKILLFNSLYYPNVIGGAELSAQLLAEGIKLKGIEPVVVCTDEQSRTDFVNGVKVYYLRTPNLYWLCRGRPLRGMQQGFLRKILWHGIDSCNFAIKKQVQEIIDFEKPDIAHTNNLAGFSVYLWKVLKKNRLPIVHTIRDLYLLCPRTNMFKHGRSCRRQCLGCKLFSFPKKALSQYVDEAVGISRFILDFHLRSGYFPKAAATCVIPNPLLSNNGAAGERKLSKQGRLRFGFVGSLSEHKGIEILLQQFSRLDADLVVFGKSLVPDYQHQLELTYGQPNILFKGWESDVAKIYRDMDVLIVPSLWNEAFGRVVIEAFSFGIPVICSNKGGLPELIEQGVTGWVYDADNAAQLRKAVEYVIEQPEIVSQMSGACVEQAGRFAIDEITEKYIEVFSMVLNK
jgi:glycosyltransferase involved in cell wall biosynthesis